MIVRKVRGQNKLKPILLSAAEYAIIKKLGVSLEDYVLEHLALIAKERRWKWWFEKREGAST